MKKCSKCNIDKLESEYHKKSGSKDGLNSQCKSCVLENGKQYRTNNKDKKSETNKKWYINNRDKVSENNKQYYTDNKDKLSENMKRYRIDNKHLPIVYSFKYNGTILYVGSTNYTFNRLSIHLHSIVNQNSNGYHRPLYQFFRNNNINTLDKLKGLFNVLYTAPDDTVNIVEMEQQYMDKLNPLYNQQRAQKS